MGRWGFRKSISLAKGVRITIGKKSVGFSAGVGPFRWGVNSRYGTRQRVTLPGTGLFWENRQSWSGTKSAPARASSSGANSGAGMTATVSPQNKFCQQCGSAIAGGARFCAGCGSPIGAASAAQPAIWYYESQGQQAGPVSQAQLSQLATTGSVLPLTLVWTDGMPDWQPYASLGRSIGPRRAISNQRSSIDMLIWCLAFAPLLGIVIAVFLTSVGVPKGIATWSTLALNIILSYMDNARLKKAGVTVGGPGAFLVPVYLFARASRLGQKPIYAIVWIIAFVIALAV
jgi:hypothetical protein